MLDTIIKNARLINGQTIEIGIQDGKIIIIDTLIDKPAMEEVYLNNEQYLSAGWIDGHVHCFEKMKLYYDYPDEIGVKKGVTTVIDAGTTGAENIGEFYDLAKDCTTNVYALLNISKWGIVEQDELADMSKLDPQLINRAILEYPDFIRGFKARMSKTVIGDNGVEPLKFAKEIQAKYQDREFTLMVHTGSAPPELQDTLSLMDKGDILTHCFNGKPNGILDQKTDTIKPCAWDAYKRGIIFDIGHGTDSFNFHTAEVALKEGMKAVMISTDIYIRNRTNGPVYDMPTTLEKLHLLGYSWEELIEKITIAPAQYYHFKTKGHIKEGYDADFTVFTFENQEKILTDSNKFDRITHEEIRPIKTMIGGIWHDCKL